MAKSQQEVPEQEEEVYSIDLSGWRVRQFRDYIKSVSENDFDLMAELIGHVVHEWPYEGDPHDPEAVLDLQLPNLLHIAKAIGAEMSASFTEGN